MTTRQKSRHLKKIPLSLSELLDLAFPDLFDDLEQRVFSVLDAEDPGPVGVAFVAAVAWRSKDTWSMH